MRRTRADSPVVPEPPREVPRWFFTRRMRAMWLCGLLLTVVGATLCLGLGVFFLALGNHPLADWRLDRRHAAATGVIRDKQRIDSVHLNSAHPWRVEFEFTLADGRTISAAGYTYDQKVAGLDPGAELAIEYDPEDPATARPVGGYVSVSPPWITAILAVALLPDPLIGLILLLVVWSRARRERLLLQDGNAAMAEVVSVSPMRAISFGRRHPFDVKYRFRDSVGQEITGRDRTYHYDWAAGLKPGDQVAVIYDPMRSESNVLWLHGDEARP